MTQPLITSNSSKKDLEIAKEMLHDELVKICFQMLNIGVIRTINYLKTKHVGEQVIFFSDYDGLKCMIGTGNKSIVNGHKLLASCWQDMPVSVRHYFARREIDVRFINNNKEKLKENLAKIMFSEHADLWLSSDKALIEKQKLEKSLIVKPKKSTKATPNNTSIKKNKV